jgi:hypothetical protein
VIIISDNDEDDFESDNAIDYNNLNYNEVKYANFNMKKINLYILQVTYCTCLHNTMIVSVHDMKR